LKCECCELNEAEVKDYRDFSDIGIDFFQEYYVCRNCLFLNDYWFLKLMKAKYPRGKKIIIAKICKKRGAWKDWIID